MQCKVRNITFPHQFVQHFQQQCNCTSVNTYKNKYSQERTQNHFNKLALYGAVVARLSSGADLMSPTSRNLGQSLPDACEVFITFPSIPSQWRSSVIVIVSPLRYTSSVFSLGLPLFNLYKGNETSRLQTRPGVPVLISSLAQGIVWHPPSFLDVSGVDDFISI